MRPLCGRHLLVTGATGFLGREFCRRVLAGDTEAEITVLGRSRGIDLEERLRLTFGPESFGRVRGVEVDWERPGLGLRKPVLDLLADVHEVWHFAARTQLDPLRQDELFTVNTAGTNYVLGLASRLPALRCFNHVSTAYVCGRRADDEPVPEALEWPKNGFRSAYEESKWLAELSVTRSGLPWRIFRPSIVVGDRILGDCDGKGIYAIARAVSQIERNARLAGQPLHTLRIPGDGGARRNLVPLDYAVPVMLAIRDRDVGLSTIYHVTADEACLQEELLDGLRPHVRIKRLLFVHPFPSHGLHPAERLISTMLRGFTAYMERSDPPFVTENTERDAGARAPYLDRRAFEFLFGRFLQLEGERVAPWVGATPIPEPRLASAVH